MDEKILNDILLNMQSSTMPAGKMYKSYPGVPSNMGGDFYTTHRDASVYNTNPQQPIESKQNIDDDYNVKTKKGKDLLVDSSEENIVEQDPEEGEESSDKSNPMSDIGGEKEDESEQFDDTEIGRIYELKKIYSRLISVESYLSSIDAGELIDLRNYISQAIDLFQTLIYNIDKFMEEIDNIIILYYKFILSVYETLKKYFKKQE